MREYVSGTVIELQTRPYYGPDEQRQLGKRIFQRMFWTFDPCVRAFPYCKPFVQVDETWLYSKYTHILLIAIAQDGNRNVLPIAFAIVDKENMESWEFFLTNLRRDTDGTVAGSGAPAAGATCGAYGSGVTRLQLNTSKSELFAAGVLEDELDSMISDHWVQGSRLLVRYLGLPPVARKLSIPDCKALIEKIVVKINHWSCNYVIISVERLFMCPEFVVKRNCHFMQNQDIEQKNLDKQPFLAMKDAAQKCLRLYHKDMPQKIKGRFEIIIAAISLQFHPL
ncbi:hypothetical protein J1N35_030665 [Gossypium stocksii]|uniref:MULE transposase domain-containing protein n=1 Tax=Gossypium stocksii TaxID=47602 RepID=A0A9D3ZU50_9ROSI|nr:hypothetical protein J1N35_030665 [Gossypium stocksii]